jgi:glycosyltransferase involved in cell wall biosynthesis
MLNNQVAAVVVTYNRLELLKKIINGLLDQVHKINKIIVVNNNSTDGTKE